MDIAKTKVDSTAAQEGRWVGDIPGMGDLRLLVRGMATPQFAATQSRLARRKDAGERERDGSLTAAAAFSVLGEAVAETVLMGWENITDSGSSIPYSKEQAVEWLTDHDYRKFQDAVVYAAQVVDNGRAAADESIMGNSESSSNGSQETTS